MKKAFILFFILYIIFYVSYADYWVQHRETEQTITYETAYDEDDFFEISKGIIEENSYSTDEILPETIELKDVLYKGEAALIICFAECEDEDVMYFTLEYKRNSENGYDYIEDSILWYPAESFAHLWNWERNAQGDPTKCGVVFYSNDPRCTYIMIEHINKETIVKKDSNPFIYYYDRTEDVQDGYLSKIFSYKFSDEPEIIKD